MKKLLITGVNGFVSGSVIAHAFNKWEIYGVDLQRPEGLPESVRIYQADLTEKQALTALFSEIRPDAVIHTAAIANIDVCENNPELGEKVNVGITQNLADLCRNAGTKLIFCSTDTVFDGTKGNYTENDQPNGINFYAKTKIKAEQIVLSSSPKNVVARLSLVMGLPVAGAGNSFLADTIEKLKKGEPVKFPSNEIRTPVDVITLGSALTELAGSDFGGIIHLSGKTCLNRFEMARFIASKLGFSKELIINTDSNAMPGRAPRPNNASMDNSLAVKTLKTPMRTLEEGLELTLNFKIHK